MSYDSDAARVTAYTEVKKQGLSIASVFVPFSKSRNRDNANESLNWRITLNKEGEPVHTFDYSAGIGHCHAYPNAGPLTEAHCKEITRECETGFGGKPGRPGKYSKPDPLDVIWSLVCDSRVIDYSGFEDWADSYGYDTDSRSAESIYRECLTLAIKLRAVLGDSGLYDLTKAFEEY